MSIFSRLKIGKPTNWTPAEFWDWFQSPKGQETMSNVPRADARSTQAQSDLATALHRVHPELVWGLAPPRDESSRWTIEISAGGLKGMIPTVQSLVQAAPDMSGWRVAAFKQPMPDFEVLLGARSRSSAQVWDHDDAASQWA